MSEKNDLEPVRNGVAEVEQESRRSADSSERAYDIIRKLLVEFKLKPEERIKPFIASVQIITNVDPYQSQLLNRFRRGSMLVPGETMLVLECAPAAYINYAVNEAEKGANIKILHVSSVGRFGRMWLSGSEAEILTARNSAVKALEGLDGRPEK